MLLYKHSLPYHTEKPLYLLFTQLYNVFAILNHQVYDIQTIIRLFINYEGFTQLIRLFGKLLTL